MLHSFRRKDENLKFDIIFQAKLSTMCVCFCVSVFVFLCRAMQIIIQRCVIKQMVFQAEPFSQPYVELTVCSPFSGFIHYSKTH